MRQADEDRFREFAVNGTLVDHGNRARTSFRAALTLSSLSRWSGLMLNVRAVSLLLRRAEDSDAIALAEVWLRSFSAALPTVNRAHSDDEVRHWFANVVVPQRETWVAVADGVVVGLLVLAEEELEQLYVEPSWQGRGLGHRFMDLAKGRSPKGLELWTFEVNEPARRFYERHGFVEVDRTDGLGNEEREPDVRLIWRP